MGFFGSLFGGQNKTLDQNISNFGNIAGTATKNGQADISDASTFLRGVLHGDTKSLAPQIGSIRKQGAQQKLSLSQFGNRSGGTNASMQASGDKTNASIHDFIASLMSNAASSLGSLGTSQEGIGLSAFGAQDDASQTQMENWKGSILGSGITEGVGYAEGFGLGEGANFLKGMGKAGA